jgi:hypothetical protein
VERGRYIKLNRNYKPAGMETQGTVRHEDFSLVSEARPHRLRSHEQKYATLDDDRGNVGQKREAARSGSESARFVLR